MSNLINGNDLALYVDVNGVNKVVCYAKNCSLNPQHKVIETTTKKGGKWETYKYKSAGYSISVSGNFNAAIGNGIALEDALRRGLKINWTFTDGKNIRYWGRVLVTSAAIDSPMDAMSTFSNQLLGDGAYDFEQLPTANTGV